MDSETRTRRHNRLHSNTFWHRHHSQQPDTTTSTNTLSSIDDAEQDINILILGDHGSGKTCLNARYVLRQFVNTGGAAQLTGGHKLVTVDPPASISTSATISSSSQVHLIVQDFPCGPWQETIDNRVPDGSVPLTGDYIYATLQSDFRQSLLTRADAVMLVCNPWSKASFEWINGVKNDGGNSPGGDGDEDGGIVNEVLEAARRKNLPRRVELLLDSLSESTSTHYYRTSNENAAKSKSKNKNLNKNSNTDTHAPTALGRPAPQINVSLPGDERREKQDRSAPTPSAPYDYELEYPVLVVGTASDRLAENGGDLPRKVRKADGQALARRFRLHGEGDTDNDEDPDARTPDGTLYTSRYMEVSARKDENVDEAFMWLIQRVLEQKARARERKRRQDAVAAFRRRVTEETERQQNHQSVGYWMAAAAEPVASLLWASQAAVTSCFRTKTARPVATPNATTAAAATIPYTVTPTVNPPMSTGQLAATDVLPPMAELPVDTTASLVESRGETPISREAVIDIGAESDGEELGFGRTTSNTDSDTASLPSLVTDTMSIYDVPIHDGYRFRSESRGPSTPVAVGPVLRPDANVGKAGRADVELGELSRPDVWI
ncbi:hypothetical protein F503_02008 [Ophiostoma piceae UAMH 11346]|uniref:Uncharacterized protein n=1 Tax=Ophiostoma piceae (strain UAMH 11346) TaxID=1262450 RepID=S3CRJ7_OPHP1|nr:hypothetical protein F503_02008 [Ophiostoma piceae UAMH 11346]